MEEPDEDIIEILDSPVKPKYSAVPNSVQKKNPNEQLASIFQVSSKSSPASKQPRKRDRSRDGQDDHVPLPSRATRAAKEDENPQDNQSGKRRKIDPVKEAQPLAERLRPTILSSYIGQSDLVGTGSLLRSMLETPSTTSSSIGSLILWGPPGCGKTTLARLIASQAEADFKELSATSSGTGDVRKVFEQAKNQLRLLGRRTILFIDEIHRFTKPQQDLFLPFVESGSVTLIGATTENPSFKVNGALLSRCRVFTLSKLSPSELVQILQNALGSIPDPPRSIPSTLLPFLADVSDGDARQALNSLELALSVCSARDKETITDRSGSDAVSDVDDKERDEELMNAIKRGLRKGYDRTGEERYDLISAMHKSIRGSDGSAAIYWLARMLEGGEDPLYVARRLIVVASEDVGLADPHGLPLAIACYQACQIIGMPECRINLAHCISYLSEAKKSTRSYEAYNEAARLAQETPLPGVPLQIRNAPTNLMKSLGYGKEYSYNPGFQHPVYNEYLPAELQSRSSFGKESLLASEALYSQKKDKQWDEARLREWEWKWNQGEDWEGRKSRIT